MSLDKLGGLVDKRSNITSPALTEDNDSFRTPTLRTEISIEFNEQDRLPLGLVKFEGLITMLATSFNLSLDERSRVAIPQLFGQDPEQFKLVSVLEYDKKVPFHIIFENGLLPSSDGSTAVPIGRFVVSGNSCLIAIDGSDDDADRVMGKLYESINGLGGIKKGISNEVIHAKSHGTASIATLRLGLADALSKSLLEALQVTVSSDDNTFKKVGAIRSIDRDSNMEKYKIVPKLQELEIVLQRVDMEAGISEPCRLSIAPRTKADVGLGEYLIMSEYDNETHHKLVEALQAKLGSK